MPASLPALLLAALLALAFLGLALADLRSRRLPDKATLPLLAAGLLVAWLMPGWPVAWPASVAGAAVAWLVLEGGNHAHRLATRAPAAHWASGGGDTKLAAALGSWLGPAVLADALCVAFLAGGGAAVVLLAAARTGLVRLPADRRIPFGPALAAGGLAGLASLLLLGDQGWLVPRWRLALALLLP